MGPGGGGGGTGAGFGSDLGRGFGAGVGSFSKGLYFLLGSRFGLLSRRLHHSPIAVDFANMKFEQITNNGIHIHETDLYGKKSNIKSISSQVFETSYRNRAADT